MDLWTQIVYETARNPALQPNPMRFSSLFIVAMIAVCFSLSVDAYIADGSVVPVIKPIIVASTATTAAAPSAAPSVVPTALPSSTVPEFANAGFPSNSAATSPRKYPAIDHAVYCLTEPEANKLLRTLSFYRSSTKIIEMIDTDLGNSTALNGTNGTAGGRREGLGDNEAVSVEAGGLSASGDSLPTSRRGVCEDMCKEVGAYPKCSECPDFADGENAWAISSCKKQTNHCKGGVYRYVCQPNYPNMSILDCYLSDLTNKCRDFAQWCMAQIPIAQSQTMNWPELLEHMENLGDWDRELQDKLNRDAHDQLNK